MLRGAILHLSVRQDICFEMHTWLASTMPMGSGGEHVRVVPQP